MYVFEGTFLGLIYGIIEFFYYIAHVALFFAVFPKILVKIVRFVIPDSTLNCHVVS